VFFALVGRSNRDETEIRKFIEEVALKTVLWDAVDVVPIDPKEAPITRWRTDVISFDIENMGYYTGMKEIYVGKDRSLV